MKSVIYFIFLFLFLNPIIAQKIVFKSNSEVKTEVVYKVQVFSSKNLDKDIFKGFIKTHRCEIEYYKSKKYGNLYRYLIVSKEPTLYSANLLLDEVSNSYFNPYIVKYFKNKRIN